VSVSVAAGVAVRHWWEQLLHNQSALWLEARLLFRKGTVLTTVPSHVDEPAADRLRVTERCLERPASP
jgi:hypothetical protein